MSKTDKAKKRARKATGKPSAPRQIKTAQPANDTADEAEVEERRASLQNARAEARRLKDMGAEVSQDPRTLEVTGAFRPDVVVMMRRAEAITPSDESAVRKFEKLISDSNGGSRSSLSALDRVSGGDKGDLGIGAHIDAAKQLQKRQRRMDPLTWALVRELCDGNLLVDRWRQVVQRRTGETADKAQAGIIRHAFRVLAAVEEMIRLEAVNDDQPQDRGIPLAG